MPSSLIYKAPESLNYYGDYILDIYNGCSYKCSYCYINDNNINTFVVKKEELLYNIEKELLFNKYKNKTINLCYACDPYPNNINNEITRKVIELLKSYNVIINLMSKAGILAIRDFDLLKSCDIFSTSVSCADNNERESYCASNKDRLYSLLCAKSVGLKNRLYFEPLYNAEYLYDLLKTMNFIDEFYVGKLKYFKSKIDLNEVKTKSQKIAKEYNRNIKFINF